MALEKVSTILHEVDKNKTAVIAFDCVDYCEVKAAITAAEEVKKPILIMMYPPMDNVIDLSTFAAIVRDQAKKVKVPVGLHLDHCGDYDYIMSAISAGFQSVMIDGSALPFEENIAISSKVAHTAHLFGADVEAELGHVGFAAKGDGRTDDMYTRPEVAAEFVERTGVDSLAVAIGSAHGFYTETPKLDLKRLDELNAAIDTPMVLHGGSGIPDDQMAEAFKRGINKLNVGTEWFYLHAQTEKEFYANAQPAADVRQACMIHDQKVLIDYIVKKLELTQMTI